MASAQTWSTVFVNEAQAAFNQFIGGIEVLTAGGVAYYSQVNVHYFEKGEWVSDPVTGRPRYIPKRVEPPHVDEIIGRAVSPRIASQRRRLSSGA
jgi:hypothetical protein